MFKKLIFIGLMLAVANALTAQEVWTLEKCVTYAQENNRNVKQSQVSVKSAKLQNKQDRFALYPQVNAGSNLGFNFGRSVNPATYQFENLSTTYNSWSLTGSVLLYNGGRLQNQIKQSATDLEAAKIDVENTASQIGLQVAQAYLQILLNEEQLKNTRRSLQTTQEQLVRTDKQIKAGALPANARFDIEATAARNEQNIVTAENNVELSYLNLKNLLELPADRDIKIETPSVIVPSEDPNAYIFKGIYAQALAAQPQIRAGELRIKSAEIGVKIAEAQLQPSLSASGSLSSNFSNTIKDYTNATPTIKDVTSAVKINGTLSTLTISQATFGSDVPTKPYGNQLGDNFGQGVGFNLQIPIFDGFTRRIGVERSKLTVENQILQQESRKQQLKTDVLTAITAAKASKKQLDAAQKTYAALKSAFEAVEKRLQTGSANTFEYTQARSSLDNAERDVTVAKYDYVFKSKVVDFYEGKKLTLK